MVKLPNNQIILNYRRMWPFVKPYWIQALFGVLLTLPIGALDSVVALFLRPVIDNTLIGRDPEFSALIPYLIVGFTVMQGVLNFTAGYINAWVGNKTTIGLKLKLYEKLLSMDGTYFDTTSSGNILQRYSNDAELAAQGLIDNLKNFLIKLFSSLGLIWVLLYNSWQLAILAVFVLVVMVYPIKKVRIKIKEVTKKTVAMQATALTLYNETFNGNKVIAAYAIESHMRDRFKSYMNHLFRLSIKMVQGSNWLSPVMHVISSIGVALVIGFGGYLIMTDQITAGNFASFLAALLMLYAPLKTVGKVFINLQKSLLAIERIFEIFAIQSTIQLHDGANELQKIEKGIVFQNVHFGYNEQMEVLHGINFTINAGQMVALVGNTGGGKTTISSLISRLYEINSGEIIIDDVNIKNYTITSLRRNIAVVFQDNFLFTGTIRENIIMGDTAASEEVIWQAVKNACLDEFINSLPNKLDTVIGERGIMLSGGQKQRVAIARAFVKDAQVVILDEATSSLDNKSEKVVQQALENLMQNRTVIVIAHRLSTVKNADNILVIQNGQILESGSHAELIEHQGTYYELYATQFTA